MLQLRGTPALSAFRRDKLLAEIQQSAPSVLHIDVEYAHFVHLEQDLISDEHDTLVKLLGDGPVTDKPPAGQLMLVTPRPGTISPWSSKAPILLITVGCTKCNASSVGELITFTRPMTRHSMKTNGIPSRP